MLTPSQILRVSRLNEQCGSGREEDHRDLLEDHKSKIEIAMELSDGEFVKLYQQQMQIWWEEQLTHGGIEIRCNRCHGIIPDATSLRRYAGRSLHPKCYQEEVPKEDSDNPSTRAYHDRVIKLLL